MEPMPKFKTVTEAERFIERELDSTENVYVRSFAIELCDMGGEINEAQFYYTLGRHLK